MKRCCISASCFTNSSGGFIRTQKPICPLCWRCMTFFHIHQVLYEYHWISQHCNFCNSPAASSSSSRSVHFTSKMLEGHWVPIGFSKKKVVPNPGFRSKSHQCAKVKHWKPLQLMWFIVLTCFNTSVSHGTHEWPQVNFTFSHHAPSLPWRDCGSDRPKESDVKIFGWLCYQVCVCCFMRWYILHRYLLLSGYPWKKVDSKCFATLRDIQGACFVPGSSPMCCANMTISKKNTMVALVLLVHGFYNPLLCEPINPVVVKQPLVHWCCGHSHELVKLDFMIEWMIRCQTPSHIPFLTAVLINLSLISATFGLQRQSHSMPCQSVSWETLTKEGVIQSFSTKTLSK